MGEGAKKGRGEDEQREERSDNQSKLQSAWTGRPFSRDGFFCFIKRFRSMKTFGS